MNNKDKKELEKVKGILRFLKKTRGKNIVGIEIDRLTLKPENENEIIISIPRKLTMTERKKTTKLVERLVKVKTRKIKYIINKELMDGITIKYKDHFWDYSLKGRLDKFTQKIGN